MGEFYEEAVLGQPPNRTWLMAGLLYLKHTCGLPPALQQGLALARRLVQQQSHDRERFHSLHAPEVACISKGMAHKRYEFDVKVGIVAALNRLFVLAAHALPSNPYDGHTLVWSLGRGSEVVRPGQRSRVEAMIRHMKDEGLLGRNWLKGQLRDALYVLLCAAGRNLHLILKTPADFFARGLCIVSVTGEGAVAAYSQLFSMGHGRCIRRLSV